MSIKSGGYTGRQHGLSMIELIMFIMIVGIALAGAVSVFIASSGRSSDPLVRKQMLTIAEALLEEVELQQFTYCDPLDTQASSATSTAGCATKVQGFGQPAAAGGVRANFNNVGNYCTEVGTGGATCTTLTLATGSPKQIPDFAGLTPSSPPYYWATISLTPEAFPTGGIPSTAAAATMNVLRIKVTVHYDVNNETLELEGYRTRWSPRTS